MTLLRLALAVVVVFALAPLLAVAGTVPPSLLIAALRDPETLRATGVSLSAASCAIGVATLIGVPAGYVAARAATAVRGALLVVFALPLALPPVASGVALLELFGRRGPLGAFLEAHGLPVVDAFPGVAIAQYDVCGSLVAVTATAAFASVDPSREDAARTLGASRLRAFATVALPLAAPGIAAGMLLAWLRALGEYGATSILAYHPTSLPIAVETTLAADGIERALALCEALLLLCVAAVTAGVLLRRPSD